MLVLRLGQRWKPVLLSLAPASLPWRRFFVALEACLPGRRRSSLRPRARAISQSNQATDLSHQWTGPTQTNRDMPGMEKKPA